jgi:hypothetical protein
MWGYKLCGVLMHAHHYSTQKGIAFKQALKSAALVGRYVMYEAVTGSSFMLPCGSLCCGFDGNAA